MLMVNYRKHEMTNPYTVQLSLLDDELILNGYGQVSYLYFFINISISMNFYLLFMKTSKDDIYFWLLLFIDSNLY